MFIHQERFQILRHLVVAQVILCLALFLISLAVQKWEIAIAVLLAISLQMLQVYFWAKPSRIRQSMRWFSGVVFAVALKYFILVVTLLILLQIMPTLREPKVFFNFSGIFFVAYVVPFWYCGIRQSTFSSDVQKQHFSTMNQ